jgi:hypothetical protein
VFHQVNAPARRHTGGMAHSGGDHGDHPIELRIGHDELVVRQRYEVVGIINDILVASWFIAGSILFFSPAHTRLGTWFFLLGSLELMIRPAIRLTRQIHLSRYDTRAANTDGQEF